MSLKKRDKNKRVRASGTRRFGKRKGRRGHDRYSNKHIREKYY